MEPVRWGVLGCAWIALERVLPAMRDTPECTLTAIASRDIAKARAAAERLGIPRAHGSYEALLDDPEIETVYIPLPNHMHVEWCERALRAGKHVLCEKPVGLDAASATPLLALRDATGLLIEEAFAIRNHPQWAAMRAVLASGEIGAARAVQAMLAYSNLDPGNIRNIATAGGGALNDIGSYAIAACRMIFDAEPVRVTATLEVDPSFGTDRLSTAILQFPTGHASLTATTQGGPTHGGTHQHFGVVAEQGWMRADFPFAHGAPTACHVFVGNAHSMASFPARQIDFPAVNQYALQGSRFSRLVRGVDAPRFPLESGIANLRVMDAIREAARSGRWEAVTPCPPATP